MITHKLPDLPYGKDALEPNLSRETLELHHGKHHAAYIRKVNELLPGSPFETASLEDISRRASGALYENGAQAWNHAFYWKCLSPDGGEPAPELAAQLGVHFGSVAGFRTAFAQAVESAFGSAWVWLVQDKGGMLRILTTANADNPLRSGHVPLLACDVWEHAYYLDHRNKRADYLHAFWNIVNWDFVAGNCALPAAAAAGP